MAREDIDYVWTDKKRTLFGLPWSFTRYYLTETKFITQVGLLTVKEDEIDLYKIIDKRQVSNLIDKYLNRMRDRYGIRGRDMVGIMHGDYHDNDDDYDHDHYDN